MTLNEARALKPEERRVRLATLLGYEVLPENTKYAYPPVEEGEDDCEDEPVRIAFDTDLNAIADVERALTDAQRQRYEVNLKLVCAEDYYEHKTHWSDNPIYAKAEQRCAALLMTLAN